MNRALADVSVRIRTQPINPEWRKSPMTRRSSPASTPKDRKTLRRILTSALAPSLIPIDWGGLYGSARWRWRERLIRERQVLEQ